MSNRIELEASYHLDDNYDNILKAIDREGFKLSADIIEEDTYFTDKDLLFITDRICLRTRLTNNNYFELTYKPKTDNSTEKYGKKEVNLKIDSNDYLDTKYVLKELGYLEYVSFKKHRKVYSKIINNFEYNIMIDEIENVGNFIELEILANNEEEKDILHDELDKLVETFECNNLKEKKQPYRDIVKEHNIKSKNIK